jgi:hypothetical protein
LRERGGERVPTFRIGARGIDGRITSIAAAQETSEFRREYRQQRLARNAGDPNATLPFGTYGLRVHHNAPVHPEPKPTAFVTKPGPLLRDVYAQLQAERSQHERQELKAHSIALLDASREALADEAKDLAADDNMTFDTPTRATVTASNERPPHRVQHRLSRTTTDPASAPRRIITLRDARRGRPPGKHGADPPA